MRANADRTGKSADTTTCVAEDPPRGVRSSPVNEDCPDRDVQVLTLFVNFSGASGLRSGLSRGVFCLPNPASSGMMHGATVGGSVEDDGGLGRSATFLGPTKNQIGQSIPAY